ncbi:MAG: hypothetical protein KKB03_03620 [Nanoarchaeota archaeon]|nr:hypothetical protein [Nanoarchaeota archaeon]MBU1135512.1 hypothetical protein [Nanoarchaeota archaeon]MBU2520302.1 hypothetical protein [Nanoarchaeota archaeon]
MEKWTSSKLGNFSYITTNKNSIKIFLSVAKHKKRGIDQLASDTKLGIDDINRIVKKLERGDLITRNPNPESQKFILGFNGQLFAEQLKNSYSEIKEFLGEESLIEPLE